MAPTPPHHSAGGGAAVNGAEALVIGGVLGQPPLLDAANIDRVLAVVPVGGFLDYGARSIWLAGRRVRFSGGELTRAAILAAVGRLGDEVALAAAALDAGERAIATCPGPLAAFEGAIGSVAGEGARQETIWQPIRAGWAAGWAARARPAPPPTTTIGPAPASVPPPAGPAPDRGDPMTLDAPRGLLVAAAQLGISVEVSGADLRVGFDPEDRRQAALADRLLSAKSELLAELGGGADGAAGTTPNGPNGDGAAAPLAEEPSWPEPIAPEAYCGLAGDAVHRPDPTTESDPVAVLAGVLVYFGNCAGLAPTFVVEETDHGLNEFVGLVGATRKSRLVVTKLDRLARSLPDARAIADELTARRVKRNLGGAVYDPTDPVGRRLFNVLGMVAEFEADLIRLRTREGLAVARAAGKLRGRKPKLSQRQEAHLVALHRAGATSPGDLAELFGVGRATVYRAISRAGGSAPSGPRPMSR